MTHNYGSLRLSLRCTILTYGLNGSFTHKPGEQSNDEGCFGVRTGLQGN